MAPALEREGYIAAVHCVQINVPMAEADEQAYGQARARERHRLAAANPMKEIVCRTAQAS